MPGLTFQPTGIAYLCVILRERVWTHGAWCGTNEGWADDDDESQ